MDIKVRIVGVVDRASILNPLRSLQQDFDQVYQKAAGGSRRSAKEQAAAVSAMVADQRRAQGSAYRANARQLADDVSGVEKAEKAKLRAIERANAEALALRIRSYKRESQEMEREERRSQARQQRLTRDWGRSVAGTAGKGARAMIGAVGEVARGAGVDATISGQVAAAVQTAQHAIRATTSGFMAKGKVATVADVASTQAAIRATGDATSTRYGDVGAGLEAFTGRSSDLELGKQTLTGLMEISQATGANFEDLATAAGSVSQSLADGPDKAARLLETMRMFGKQASMGSVELKDMATYMSRLSSSSEKFAGDRGKTMSQFGAIAQMAVHSGRSTSAEATNAAASLAADLANASTGKRLKANKIDVFSDASGTKMKSVEDIFVDVFRKTNGRQDALSNLFRNRGSRSAIESMSDVYNQAGGGELGIAAIRAKFAEFGQTLDEATVRQMAALQKSSDAGRANDINNRMQLMAANALERLVPAAEKLAPAFGKLADGVDWTINKLSTDPGKVVRAGLIAVIAKSGAEAALTNLATGAGGANMQLAKLSGAAILAVGAWAAAADQIKGLMTSDADKGVDKDWFGNGLGNLPDHWASQAGQTQDEITNAIRQGKTPMLNGKEIAVTGQGASGKWLTEDLADEWSDPGDWEKKRAAQRAKTQEVIGLWKPRLDADADMKESLARSRVGSKEWQAANPGVDPTGKAPSQLKFVGAETKPATPPTRDAAADQAKLLQQLSLVHGALVSGIKVTNLSELKGAPIAGGTRVNVVP